MNEPQAVPSSLKRSKRFATIALITAVVTWLLLMVVAKFVPTDKVWIIHILMLSAEAGVVGGLADWYAITVLFRNPFGKMPIPKLLRDHTEIIPRNKDRIAESMGRFVQENFLSPQVVEKACKVPTCLWRLVNGSPIRKTIYKSPKSFNKRCLKSLSLWAKNKSDALFKVTACSGCATLKSIIWPVKCCVQC